MAKKNNGSNETGMGFGKNGKEAVKQGRGRDAAGLFRKAQSPASVKAMLGEGAKYKHASN
jgi:hypothetical protein